MPVELPEKVQLGEILVRRNILTREQLSHAVDAQGASPLPLGSTIVRLGLADELQIVAALAEQWGVPAVDLRACVVPTEVLSVIPYEIARAHQILPLAFEGSSLRLAAAAPNDKVLLDEVAFATGRSVLPFVALRQTIEEMTDGAYRAYQEGERLWHGPQAGPQKEPFVKVLSPLTGKPGAPQDVELDSELPEGSFGSFTQAPPAPLERDSSKPRILAVDDEEDILELLDTLLTHRGMEVIRASRGRQALELLRSTRPDLVLLDAMLPEIHGFEICGNIKRSEQYRNIPVIMISAIYKGFNFIQDVKRIHGADDYITKPFKVSELVRRVEAILERQKGSGAGGGVEASRQQAAQALSQATEHLKRGRAADAVEAASRAVRADALDPRGHFTLGVALHKIGRIYEAISEYERVVELAPSEFSALKNLAVLYERQGFKSKAVEMWMRAMDESPSEPVRKTIKAHLIGLL